MSSPPRAAIDISEFQKLFSVVATPLLLVDLASEKILFLNHSAEELTGHCLDEGSEGFPFPQLFSGQYLKVIAAIVELARAQGPSFSGRENDIELRRKSGRLCPINLSAAQMRHHERDFLVITLEDLSQAKKNEKERRELLQKATHNAKLVDIGRLAAGMAHELNNPLAILDGYSESLESLIMAEDYNPTLMRKNILPIRKSAQRMSQIVTKMMGKIRNKDTNHEVKSLQQVVQEALIILEEMTLAQSIKLTVEVGDQWVNCDATQIEQIITNIVMNAFNALENRKEGREIRITSSEKNGMNVLELWNNGDPIPDHVQAKIFTPFFTTKQPGEGTGLGLFMSFNIMKAHSGELNFKSNTSFGTSFYLSFPKVDVQLAQKPPVVASRALVVDEELFFRKLVHKKLSHLDLNCAEAGDADDALKQIESLGAALKLVLINASLSGTKDCELLLKIREKHPELRCVLVLEEAPTIERQQELKNLQIYEVLSKPLRTVDLAQLLGSEEVPTDSAVGEN
ncbi:ATP-binding protein [Bdellovibrio sp. HCB337]|uniref:hybrid sensor histidine kinase/response regulator n=1 Tax=Bdellovibrio sp. HCB337 TaxID=3394358 RepID=UPI0039A408F9